MKRFGSDRVCVAIVISGNAFIRPTGGRRHVIHGQLPVLSVPTSLYMVFQLHVFRKRQKFAVQKSDEVTLVLLGAIASIENI